MDILVILDKHPIFLVPLTEMDLIFWSYGDFEVFLQAVQLLLLPDVNALLDLADNTLLDILLLKSIA